MAELLTIDGLELEQFAQEAKWPGGASWRVFASFWGDGSVVVGLLRRRRQHVVPQWRMKCSVRVPALCEVGILSRLGAGAGARAGREGRLELPRPGDQRAAEPGLRAQ